MNTRKETLVTQIAELREVVDDAVQYGVLSSNCAHHTQIGIGLKVFLKKLVDAQKALLAYVHGRELEALRGALSNDTILYCMVNLESCSCQEK